MVSGDWELSAAQLRLGRGALAHSTTAPRAPAGARWVGANPEPPLEDGRAPHRQPPPKGRR
jgi:hypothetical protein